MKEIVIIGGGSAGVAFAQTAAKKVSSFASYASNSSEAIRITLIEKNKFFFHVFGSLRALVDVSIIPNLFVPYDNVVQGCDDHFVMKRATVKAINYSSKIVTYTSHEENDHDYSITYDYLILATGSTYPSPIKPHIAIETRQEMEESFRDTGKRIKNSQRILVIGGGAVGIEMAGELKAFYPHKTIMLLDRHTELLSNQNVPKVRPHIKKALEDHGVQLLLGQTLVGERFTEHQFGYKKLTTESGMVIESDAQLVCVGMKANTNLMTDPSCLDERSFIQVKDTMQVDHQNYENHVFVLGDASNHPTPKMGYWAMQQGSHLAESLIKHIMVGEALVPFDGPDTEAIIIPLGPRGGVTQLPLCGGFVVGNFMTRMIKSKDLMVEMSWKNLNAKMPK